ncbi:response regulator transcription factor [Paenibacillus sp.]|uniref:response regulator transcription factor n=1 Tax=Paenibacillus sp. TaxID=58172 RepID=UPI002D6313B0|nr:response regulator transcription factor [Paenibacillus sp.]HZG88430.1 response regulator transcription factor [Paenibacillus sp.]
MDPIKVMIVEDQELIRSSLQIVLGIESDLAVVGAAENGAEAVALCEERRPDVVLMDIHMPVMDGIEATKRIKKANPQTKIIILTTFQEMDFVIEALQAGAEGYLLKAIDTKDLVAGVRVVAHGGTLITQEIAKALFAGHIQKSSGGESPSEKYMLSKRETEILQCLADGLSNEAIAEKLFLSMGTVKNYISNLYAKLDVAGRAEAVRKARTEELL